MVGYVCVLGAKQALFLGLKRTRGQCVCVCVVIIELVTLQRGITVFRDITEHGKSAYHVPEKRYYYSKCGGCN